MLLDRVEVERGEGALAMRGVHRGYRVGVGGCRGEVSVLRGVELDVGAGELLALLGAPGSGRTTLLLCAAGLLPPDAGQVRWFGAPRRGAAPPGWVSFVAARPPAYPCLTVREALELAPVPGATPRRVRDALELLALGAHAGARIERLPAQLLARVALARALAGHARLLLVDAPAMLTDADGSALVAEALRAFAHAGGAAVVTVPDGRSALGLTSGAIVLADGRVHASAAARSRDGAGAARVAELPS